MRTALKMPRRFQGGSRFSAAAPPPARALGMGGVSSA
jgi:hypothetical protein